MVPDVITTRLSLTMIVWNVVVGFYHLLLVYALNKYGIQEWIQTSSSSRKKNAPWLKEERAVPATGAINGVKRDEDQLHELLDDLVKRGWRTEVVEGVGIISVEEVPMAAVPALELTSVEPDAQGRRHNSSDIRVAYPESDREIMSELEIDDEYVDEGVDHDHHHKGKHHRATAATKGSSSSLPCFLVLVFQGAVSKGQVRRWAEKMQKLFGSTPRVERFEHSTVVQLNSWTHEGMLHKAAAVVQEATEEDIQCTLQVDSWGVFLEYRVHQVELIKLQDFNIPAIKSATPTSADMLKITGHHLNGAKLIAQTHGRTLTLLSECRPSLVHEMGTELEVLTVQFNLDGLQQGVEIYASKVVDIAEGSLVSIRSGSATIMLTDDGSSTTAWILAALIMAVPMAQMYWPYNPSLRFPAMAVASQVFSWILGWLAVQLLNRYINFRKKWAPELVEGKDRGMIIQWRRGGGFLLLLLLLLTWTQFSGFSSSPMLSLAVIAIVVGGTLRRRMYLRNPGSEEIISHHKHYTNLMRAAITYDEWTGAASMLDMDSALNEWKLYDEGFVVGKLEELQARRTQGSIDDVLFSLRVDLTRNLGNICNPRLHKGRQQLPLVVQDYIEEVRNHLQAVCQMDPEVFTSEEKLSFFIEMRQKFGRTALVFSGDVALGTFHSSVIRTLVERRLFPSVVVGANMGAVVAAFATTRTILELQLLFDDPAPPKNFYEKLTTVYVAAHRLRFQEASPYEIEKLQQSMRDLLGDLTFEEAYDLSGRVLGISVPACVGRNQPAQFLNYLTSPHVVIWSAAALSCAPPLGLLSTPELMIKDRNGNIVPYVPPAKMTLHGSGGDTVLEAAIPFQQLRELFNVNHFIISQASPYLAPWVHFKDSAPKRSKLGTKLIEFAEMEVRHRFSQLVDLGISLQGFANLYAQRWEGDINIILPITFAQAISVFRAQNDDPSPDYLRQTAMAGRRCTWAKLSAIQASCAIELMLDEIISSLSHFKHRDLSCTSREDNYPSLDDPVSPRSNHSGQFKNGCWATTTIMPQSWAEDDPQARDYGPPQEQSRGYYATSDSGTDDYLLDHLCLSTRNNPLFLTSDILISEEGHNIDPTRDLDESNPMPMVPHISKEEMPRADGNNALVTTIGVSELQSSREETMAVDPYSGTESVDQQEVLDDTGRYNSPMSVLEGPTGNTWNQGKKFHDIHMMSSELRNVLGELNSIDAAPYCLEQH